MPPESEKSWKLEDVENSVIIKILPHSSWWAAAEQCGEGNGKAWVSHCKRGKGGSE